jgi:hypothetical protein
MGSKTGIDGALDVSVVGYTSPDGRQVGVVSNMGVLFSDGFGGAAVDTTFRWDVLDGGVGVLRNGQIVAGIGSGTIGITDSVANSALTVAMGTISGAERWYLSQQIFAGTEDVTIVLSKSQSIVANSIQAILVEVNPSTGLPVVNPNFAGQFNNVGGVEFGASATNTAFSAVAIEDASPVMATGSVGVAIAALTTTSEFLIEFHAEDIICSNGAVDSVAAKGATPSRVSTQCPNDGKSYKLLLRFRNTSAATATSVVIQRVIVVDTQELRVEVASGRGDINGQKAVAVNVASLPALPAGANTIGAVRLVGNTSGGIAAAGATRIHAATIATGVNIKATAGQSYGWDLFNASAGTRFVHLYAKASAPVLATDTPEISIAIGAGQRATFWTDFGVVFALGMGFAVSTDNIAIPATAATAGDVQGVIFTV